MGMQLVLSAVSLNLWMGVFNDQTLIQEQLSSLADNGDVLSSINAVVHQWFPDSQSRKAIKEVVVVSGPGSFTSLRVSASWAKGFCAALGIPMLGLATANLYTLPFFIPLQPMKTQNLDLKTCLDKGLSFLKIMGVDQHHPEVPGPSDLVLGTKENSMWPTGDVIKAAIANRKNLEPSFKIRYGIEASVSGQRLPEK